MRSASKAEGRSGSRASSRSSQRMHRWEEGYGEGEERKRARAIPSVPMCQCGSTRKTCDRATRQSYLNFCGVYHLYTYTYNLSSTTVLCPSLHMRVQKEFLRRLGVRDLEEDEVGGRALFCYSIAIIALSAVLGSCLLYAALLSKLLPRTGNVFLDAVKDDQYYCYFVPLAILPTYLVLYLNWLSLTYFINN